MCIKKEREIEKYGAAIFFFINGISFSITWEKLGTNHAWAYNNLGPMISGIPFLICIGWGILSLLSTFILTKSSKKFLYHSSPLILSLFVEPCAIRLGFWNYFFLNGAFLALLPYFVFGYLWITIFFKSINNAGWKYVLKPKNPVMKVVVMLSCMFLFAINGIFVYSILSIIYFKKIPTWLFSRLFFD